MIIRFDSKVDTFIMMGDIATQLISMMGHSGAVPGALLAADIPRALANLRTALDAIPPEPDPDDDEQETRPRERPVTLRQRAYPLIDLLQRAHKADCAITWAVEPPGSARS